MNILHYILYGIIWTLAWLPMWVWYIVSDVCYFIIYYVVRYRRDIAWTNLTNSFPDKSRKELKEIEKKFYQYFCDTFFETFHLLHCSEKWINKHMVFSNTELLRSYLTQKRNVILMLGHYGNWEYMGANPLLYKDLDFIAAGVYKKQRNKFVDALFKKLRTRFGATAIEKKELFRKIYSYNKMGKAISFAMMADQTPTKKNIHYWTNFLNQDTPIFTGGERMARRLNFVLLYVDIKRIKRGYYQATYSLIDDDVPHSEEFADTEKYTRLMEQTIERDPAYWLWTHKRWKHKREL